MTTESTNRLDEQAQAAVSRSERIAGAAGVATIAAFFLFCIVESVTVGVGTLGQPKSGFWPLVVAVAGLGLSIWALLMPSTSFDVVPGGSLRSVVAASADLGLPITSFLLSMVLLKFIGKEGWVLSGVVSALLAGGSYYVFVVLLRVPM
jgi:hypothetical protein